MGIFKKISAFFGRFCKKFVVKTRYEIFESELKSLQFFATLKVVLLLATITAAISCWLISKEWTQTIFQFFIWNGILTLITYIFFVKTVSRINVFCNDYRFINNEEAIMIIIATYIVSRRHFKFILKHIFPDQLKGIDDDIPRFPDHF